MAAVTREISGGFGGHLRAHPQGITTPPCTRMPGTSQQDIAHMECVQFPLCEMRWRAGTPSSMPQVVLSAEGCSEECTQLVCCRVEHQ